MFKLNTQNSYKWPVHVQIPGNGAFKESTFTAEFKIIPQSQIDALGKDPESNDLVRDVLIGWDGVVDEDGTPVIYTDDVKAQLIDIPYVKMALARAFFGSIAGRLPKT